MRTKKSTKYFKGLKKIKEQVLPNSMIPRSVDMVRDSKANVIYLVDWRDKKYTSVKSDDIPKDSEWDYNKKNWSKIAA